MRKLVLVLLASVPLAACAAPAAAPPAPSPVAAVVTTEPLVTGQTPASTFGTADPNVPFGSVASYPAGATGMGRTVRPAF